MSASSNSYGTLNTTATVAVHSPYAITDTQLKIIKTRSIYTARSTLGVLKNASKTVAGISIKARSFNASEIFPTPRTELGKKLLAHRRSAIARGIKLLTADDINLIVSEGRGFSS